VFDSLLVIFPRRRRFFTAKLVNDVLSVTTNCKNDGQHRTTGCQQIIPGAERDMLATRSNTARATPVRDPLRVARDEMVYGLKFLGAHWWRLGLWFFGLLLPVWGFASLVGDLHKNPVFAFDVPILTFLHAQATPARNAFFVFMSRIGFLWGVIPMDVAIVAWLALRRQFRNGLFFGLCVAGSAILDMVGKNYFARARPDLWLSITPEFSYSFPSGHAMGSSTLGLAVVALCWPTRWRWPVLIATVVFVLLVGLSRLYLGVHYPSDILAGWCAATAWVFGMYILVDRKSATPPVATAANDDTVGQNQSGR
jgi:membrane-associated phospholipid phosphatase